MLIDMEEGRPTEGEHTIGDLVDRAARRSAPVRRFSLLRAAISKPMKLIAKLGVHRSGKGWGGAANPAVMTPDKSFECCDSVPNSTSLPLFIRLLPCICRLVPAARVVGVVP